MNLTKTAIVVREGGVVGSGRRAQYCPDRGRRQWKKAPMLLTARRQTWTSETSTWMQIFQRLRRLTL